MELGAVIFANIVEGLISKDIFTGIVNSMVIKVSAVASAIVTAMWVINFGWNYFTNSIKNQAKKIDFSNLVGSLAIVGLLWLYIPVVGGLINVAFLFNDAVKLSDSEWDAMVENVFEQSNLKMNDMTNDDFVSEDGTVIDYQSYVKLPASEKVKYARETNVSTQEELSMWAFDPIKIGSSMLAGITAVLTSIIRIIMEVITVAIIKIMYVVGPLAIVFSLVPLWKDKLGTWFSTLINMCFVLTTMSILDQLILGSAWDTVKTGGLIMTGTGLTEQSIIGQLGGNVAYIVCYLLVFWLTSKYIGSDDAGKVIGTSLQTALVAAGASKLFSGSGGGGSVGGGDAANTVGSTAKDPMRKANA